MNHIPADPIKDHLDPAIIWYHQHPQGDYGLWTSGENAGVSPLRLPLWWTPKYLILQEQCCLKTLGQISLSRMQRKELELHTEFPKFLLRKSYGNLLKRRIPVLASRPQRLALLCPDHQSFPVGGRFDGFCVWFD